MQCGGCAQQVATNLPIYLPLALSAILAAIAVLGGKKKK